jgi:hypothetical protein
MGRLRENKQLKDPGFDALSGKLEKVVILDILKCIKEASIKGHLHIRPKMSILASEAILNQRLGNLGPTL